MPGTFARRLGRFDTRPSENGCASIRPIGFDSVLRSYRRCRRMDLPKGTPRPGRTRSARLLRTSPDSSGSRRRSRGASCFSDGILAGCAGLSRGLADHFFGRSRRGLPRSFAAICGGPGNAAARWHGECDLPGKGPPGPTSRIAGGFNHVHRRWLAGADPDHRHPDLDLLGRTAGKPDERGRADPRSEASALPRSRSS